MGQVKVFDQNVQQYDRWFEDHDAIFQSEVLAVKAQLAKLPQDISGIEVGLGTGRFSQALGIREGVEPSENMRRMAIKRGIETMDARAESLPYKDLHFDFVLFVTICHLDDVERAFREAHRVLKPDGHLLVGLIPADSPIGEQYEEKRKSSTFYRQATFYRMPRVAELLKEAGFRNFDYMQTLVGVRENIQSAQAPKEGWEQGSFVVVKAEKR